jgi:hypothetical protein
MVQRQLEEAKGIQRNPPPPPSELMAVLRGRGEPSSASSLLEGSAGDDYGSALGHVVGETGAPASLMQRKEEQEMGMEVHGQGLYEGAPAINAPESAPFAPALSTSTSRPAPAPITEDTFDASSEKDQENTAVPVANTEIAHASSSAQGSQIDNPLAPTIQKIEKIRRLSRRPSASSSSHSSPTEHHPTSNPRSRQSSTVQPTTTSSEPFPEFNTKQTEYRNAMFTIEHTVNGLQDRAMTAEASRDKFKEELETLQGQYKQRVVDTDRLKVQHAKETEDVRTEARKMVEHLAASFEEARQQRNVATAAATDQETAAIQQVVEKAMSDVESLGKKEAGEDTSMVVEKEVSVFD